MRKKATPKEDYSLILIIDILIFKISKMIVAQTGGSKSATRKPSKKVKKPQQVLSSERSLRGPYGPMFSQNKENIYTQEDSKLTTLPLSG